METAPRQQPLWDWNGQPPLSEPEQLEKPPVFKAGQPKNINPCLALYGPHSDETTRCKDCVHLIGIALSRTIYKCELRKNMRSARTDHHLRWPACAKFEERVSNMRLYDGRG